jgi:hypothetical protein
MVTSGGCTPHIIVSQVRRREVEISARVTVRNPQRTPQCLSSPLISLQIVHFGKLPD